MVMIPTEALTVAEAEARDRAAARVEEREAEAKRAYTEGRLRLIAMRKYADRALTQLRDYFEQKRCLHQRKLAEITISRRDIHLEEARIECYAHAQEMVAAYINQPEEAKDPPA